MFFSFFPVHSISRMMQISFKNLLHRPMFSDCHRSRFNLIVQQLIRNRNDEQKLFSLGSRELFIFNQSA